MAKQTFTAILYKLGRLRAGKAGPFGFPRHRAYFLITRTLLERHLGQVRSSSGS